MGLQIERFPVRVRYQRELRGVSYEFAGSYKNQQRAAKTLAIILPLALISVLTSAGRGSDVMVPMAIPSSGGMLTVLVSIFVVPVLYCRRGERRLAEGSRSVIP